MKVKQKQIKTTTKKATTKKAPIHARVRDHAKHVLVPHKANEYHPHLIRPHGLVAVLVIALVIQLGYSVITTGKIYALGVTPEIQASELLLGTNNERQKANLNALELSAPLSEAAFLKAQNMFKEQYWAHISPSGTQPWRWFAEAGYDYSYAGENLAKNYPTAQATIEAWMNSPSHRDNILKDSYKDVGFAVLEGNLKGEDTVIIVAMYGAPATEAGVSSTTETLGFSASGVDTATPTPAAYFASAFASLSPVTFVVLGLFAIVAVIGAITHFYRNKLPSALKKSWRSHHGLYTVAGMVVLGFLIVVATGSGSI